MEVGFFALDKKILSIFCNVSACIMFKIKEELICDRRNKEFEKKLENSCTQLKLKQLKDFKIY